MVRSVAVTSGSSRTRAPIDSRMTRVDSRLEPSGARTVTSNCDSSSLGMKFLLATMKRGTVVAKVRSMTTTTAKRWRMDHPRIAMYVLSTGA